jgi:Uma2 family endonuclease
MNSTGIIPQQEPAALEDSLYEVVNGQIVIPNETPPDRCNTDPLYEVINGQVMELPPMGAFEVDVASDLVFYLRQFAKKYKLGRAVAEMLFLLDRGKDLQRRPDVAVVTYQRWPRNRKVPRTNAWDVVPELAVEVVSASNTANEIMAKIREYFAAGVQRVWVIYPTEEQVYVYRSPIEPRVLTRDMDLDGEDILPGFRLRVSALFEDDGQEAP